MGLEFNNLCMQDLEVWSNIMLEKERQQNGIELIASENLVSKAVMEAMGTYLTNKYAEGYPNKRYYGGCQYIDKIEQLAIDRAKKLFGAEHANVQPHSGAQANMAAYQAILKPGDTVIGMSLENGGHLTHGAPVNQSGKLYNFVPYGVNKDGLIDYDELRVLVMKYQPRLVLAGASAYSRQIDFARIKGIVDEYNNSIGVNLRDDNLSPEDQQYNKENRCYFMVDMAHIAGLVAAGLHQSPVPYADIVTTTTHKTLRGPRGGLILCKEELARKIDSAIFPGTQGGPLEHIIAAKAVCFKEALQPEFVKYQKQIIQNCVHLAHYLSERGFDIVSGGTDNHLFLVDLRNKGITGIEAQNRLDEVGITLNKNTVPNETQKPMIASGIRIGTAAVTTRGFKEDEMKEIADIIDIALSDDFNILEVKNALRTRVRKLCDTYPIYQ